MKAIFKNAWGYQGDNMNLPVADAHAAARFYECTFGFSVESKGDDPRSVVLKRDDIRIGLVENGSDPTQDGCAFEVDNVGAAYDELKANGLSTSADGADPTIGKISPELKIERHGDGSEWKVFFVVAPDGLCYWFGERVSAA